MKFVSGASSHESVMNLLLFGRMFVVFMAQLCESRDFFQKGKQKGGFLCSFNEQENPVVLAPSLPDGNRHTLAVQAEIAPIYRHYSSWDASNPSL